MLRLSLARLTGESHSRGSDQMLQHFSHVIISPQNPCKSKMLHRHFSYPVTLQPPLHRSSPKFLIGGALVTHFCHIFMRSGWLACCHKDEVSYHMFPCCVFILIQDLPKLFHSFPIWTQGSQYLQKTVTYYHKCAALQHNFSYVPGLWKPD